MINGRRPHFLRNYFTFKLLSFKRQTFFYLSVQFQPLTFTNATSGAIVAVVTSTLATSGRVDADFQ